MIDLHCHTNCFGGKGGAGGPPPENFYILEALGLHFSMAFSKANSNRIGGKLTAFYIDCTLLYLDANETENVKILN